MKRNKLTVLILAITTVLSLGIFFSFYWSLFGVSDEDPGIVLPVDGETTAPEPGTGTPVEKVEITKENVQRVIASMSRPETCSYQSRVTLYSSTGSTSWKNNHYVKNGYTKTEQYNASGTLIKHIITGKGMIYVWRPGGDARYWSGHLGDANSDTEQRIPTYEDIVNRDPSELLDAKYVSYNGGNCIYVKAGDPELEYVDEYWISLDYGLLIHAVTSLGEQVIYEMELGGISTDAVSDNVFLLPNNKLVTEES